MVLPISPALAIGALGSVFKQKSSLDQLNDLYQRTVGRDVDKKGYDYWSNQLANNQTSLSNIESLLKDSQEYQDRAATVKQYQDSGRGNPAESVLDALDSAYKGEFASPGVTIKKVSGNTNTSNPQITVAGSNNQNTTIPTVTAPVVNTSQTSNTNNNRNLTVGGGGNVDISDSDRAAFEAAANMGPFPEAGQDRTPIFPIDTDGNPIKDPVITTANNTAKSEDRTIQEIVNTGKGDVVEGGASILGYPSFDINQIFNDTLGRDVGEEGSTYWNDEYNRMIGSGMDHDTAQQSIINSIKSGKEHSGRQGIVDYFSNRYGFNPSESFLDAYIGPGGVSLRDLPTGQQTQAPAPTTNDGWWNQFEDANAFKSFLSEGQQTQAPQESEFDQFTKFLTAIQGLGGMGGGMGNYGYGGYGGFTPGGVAAASPTSNMMNFMNAFRNMRGTSSPAVTTGNIGF